MTRPPSPRRVRPVHRPAPRPPDDDAPTAAPPTAAFVAGDHVQHARFGAGLVVEVRVRDGREILEVVFSDQVRSLDARHPLLTRMVSPAFAGGESSGECSWEWEPESEAVVQAVLDAAVAPPEHVALRLEAEALGLVRGFERLVALDAIRDVARYAHQIDATRRVLRDMQGARCSPTKWGSARPSKPG